MVRDKWHTQSAVTVLEKNVLKDEAQGHGATLDLLSRMETFLEFCVYFVLESGLLWLWFMVDSLVIAVLCKLCGKNWQLWLLESLS